MPIEYIDAQKCIGCAECLSSCPADVFRWDELRGLPEIRSPQECQSCNLCVLFCPAEAIVHTDPVSFRFAMFPA